MLAGNDGAHSNFRHPQFFTLVRVFLWIGMTGFGGALATIALMEQEWVEKRKRLTHEQFLEGMAFCYLLPGPFESFFLRLHRSPRIRECCAVKAGRASLLPRS